MGQRKKVTAVTFFRCPTVKFEVDREIHFPDCGRKQEISWSKMESFIKTHIPNVYTTFGVMSFPDNHQKLQFSVIFDHQVATNAAKYRIVSEVSPYKCIYQAGNEWGDYFFRKWSKTRTDGHTHGRSVGRTRAQHPCVPIQNSSTGVKRSCLCLHFLAWCRNIGVSQHCRSWFR